MSSPNWEDDAKKQRVMADEKDQNADVDIFFHLVKHSRDISHRDF